MSLQHILRGRIGKYLWQLCPAPSDACEQTTSLLFADAHSSINSTTVLFFFLSPVYDVFTHCCLSLTTQTREKRRKNWRFLCNVLKFKTPFLCFKFFFRLSTLRLKISDCFFQQDGKSVIVFLTPSSGLTGLGRAPPALSLLQTGWRNSPRELRESLCWNSTKHHPSLE